MNPYTELANKLNFECDLPFTPDWSADSDFLNLIADYCIASKPSTITECSSGLSTLILARCCQINKQGQVYSLENGVEYANKTRQQLIDFDLQDYATVIDAPLEETTIDGEVFQWYSMGSLTTDPIDMLVIDGPSGFIQKNSRYPALPLLHKQLSEQAAIFLDDAAREDEKYIIKLWLKNYPELQNQYIKTDRGCSILTRK